MVVRGCAGLCCAGQCGVMWVCAPLTLPKALLITLACSLDPDHDCYFVVNDNGVTRTLKKLRSSKGDYWIKQ